jgi:hypothetical protein
VEYGDCIAVPLATEQLSSLSITESTYQTEHFLKSEVAKRKTLA